MCIHPNILSPSTIPMSFVWSLEISSSWWWLRSKKFLTDFFCLATKSQQQQIRNVFKSHSGNDDDDRSQTTKKDFPSTDKVSLFSSSCRGLDSAKVRLLSLPLLPTYVRRFFWRVPSGLESSRIIPIRASGGKRHDKSRLKMRKSATETFRVKYFRNIWLGVSRIR